MKPAPFEYQAPAVIEEALSALAEHGEGAKLLAGGQSLIPAMNFRVVQPALLVDLNRLDDLRYVRQGGRLFVGGRDDHPASIGARSERGRERPAAGTGVAVHRPPADPQPGHPGRQPGACRSGGRAAGGGGGGTGQVSSPKPGRGALDPCRELLSGDVRHRSIAFGDAGGGGLSACVPSDGLELPGDLTPPRRLRHDGGGGDGLPVGGRRVQRGAAGLPERRRWPGPGRAERSRPWWDAGRTCRRFGRRPGSRQSRKSIHWATYTPAWPTSGTWRRCSPGGRWPRR